MSNRTTTQTLKTVFLSRVLCPGLPLYGGRTDNFSLEQRGDLSRGDSAASCRVSLSNHAGTHMDFPAHVHINGRTLDDYPPEFFVFSQPLVLEIKLSSSRYITAADLDLEKISTGADLLLLKTDIAYGGDEYWRDSPGLDPTAAELLKNLPKPPRCLGLDFISLNRWPDREPGRVAHKILLAEPEIIIIEDMDLSPLNAPGARLRRVAAVPFRLAGVDGTPVTVMAELDFSGGGGNEDF